jgi:hypothetical protein
MRLDRESRLLITRATHSLALRVLIRAGELVLEVGDGVLNGHRRCMRGDRKSRKRVCASWV